MRALVVEDDQRLRSLVVRTLARAGLACDEAERVSEAEELLSVHDYDLLVLTALDDPASTVEGLSDGADDYLGKPFDLEVLVARAHALLRRNQQRTPSQLVSGSLKLDPGRRMAWCDDAELALTAREFAILETLMRRAGGVLSREEILEQAWGEREEPMSNTIDVLIARLRKKLDAHGSTSRIETVRGMGYRLT